MTRLVKCHLCQRRVRSADVTFDLDGDPWCAVNSGRCYQLARRRLYDACGGVAEDLAQRHSDLFEVPS